jgi:hypothetical protein
MLDNSKLKVRSQFILNKIESYRLMSEDLEKRLITAKDKQRKVASALVFLQYMARKMNEEKEMQVARLSTLALKEVFPDLDLTLEIQHIEIRNSPGTEILIKDNKKGFTGYPEDSFGGGPQSLLNIIMRVITIVRQPSLRRILFLDEPLAAISKKYQAKAAKLMRKLSDPPQSGGLGFSILMVTHNPEFMKGAKNAYELIYDNEKQSPALQKLTEEQISTLVDDDE